MKARSVDEQSPGEHAIELEGVTKAYDDNQVLRGVDLEVRYGEQFCLLGANGSGKSTLLSILSGVRYQDEGRARVLGLDPRDPSLKPRRGVQLERPVFPFYAKVGEVAWLFSGFFDDPPDHKKLIEWFRLDPGAYIRQLSKGQRQALALLLALMSDPELLYLDEPTSGLDPKARHRLWHRVNGFLAQDERRTLLFTTHDLRLAQEKADRAAVLHRGRIVAIGKPQELCEEWVGTGMKVSIAAESANGFKQSILQNLPEQHFRSTSDLGEELVIYTDDTKTIVSHLPVDDRVRVSIEKVTLQDVYFKLTGDTLSEA